MIKTKIFLILGNLFLLFVLTNSCSYWSTTEVIDRVKSPNEDYEIKIWRKENFGLDDTKYISLTTFKNNKEFSLKDPLYFEKDYDGDYFPDFESVYPTREWINSKVFWMGSKNKPETANNKITIRNSSRKHLNQVVIQAMGYFSIYDLEINEAIDIPNFSNINQNDSFYTSIAVYYSDGTSIPSKGYGLLLLNEPILKNDRKIDIIINSVSATVSKHQ